MNSADHPATLDATPAAAGMAPAPAPGRHAREQSAEEFSSRAQCPNCGATETRWIPERGHQFCDWCRSYFDVDAAGVAHLVRDDVENLRGPEIAPGAGAHVAAASDDDVVTLRCPTCGAAEMVHARTDLATFRCHWCRNMLTVTDRIANGARPDAIVPFALPREQAQAAMAAFLKKRRFFANRTFLADYRLENIAPVYFPYFMVDVNAQAQHAGHAADLVRTYTRGDGKDEKRYWDYDVYRFERRFDLRVNDLLLQANAESADTHDVEATNNIVGSMAPWPSSAIVRYDPLYLQGGFRAEPRTLNIDDVRPRVSRQVIDLSRREATATMSQYDHGIRYEQDRVQPIGERWVSVLCPVWLFSYLEVTGSRRKLHYIAVNGVTGEIAGSVPVSKPRLLVVSGIAQVLGMIAGVGWFLWA